MTNDNLKNEMLDTVSTLKKQGKVHLAKCIEENWDKNVVAYSRELNTWKPEKPMENELTEAIKQELTRLDTDETLIKKILESLKEKRIMQTAPHLGATEGPRMLYINWLASLGIEEKDFYVIGMFSGIPFSNSFRPGRINKKENPINLFPSNLQDGLVYQSTIQDKLVESIKNVPSELGKLFPKAVVGESYTKWALKTCQNLERKILNKENMIFLDINEIASNYLMQVLTNKEHVLHKIFFDEEIRKDFIEIFPNENIFYLPVMDGKYEKMENVTLSGNVLKSKNKEIKLDSPDILINEIKNNRLCPSLILTFTIISFINQFKCFGSFFQVEYLPIYQEKVAKLRCMKNFNIEKVPTSNLTTGVLKENMDISPVDIILGEKFKNNENILFGELLLPLKEKFINEQHQKSTKK